MGHATINRNTGNREEEIVELRSATQGAATFTAKLDHLSELTGKLADSILATRAHAA